jgi:hypothetical protein
MKAYNSGRNFRERRFRNCSKKGSSNAPSGNLAATWKAKRSKKPSLVVRKALPNVRQRLFGPFL